MSTRPIAKRRQRPDSGLVDIVDIEYLLRNKEKNKSASYETSAIVDIHETRKGNMGVSYSYATQEVTCPRGPVESVDPRESSVAYHQETFTFLESNIFMAEPGESDHDDASVQGNQESVKKSKKRVSALEFVLYESILYLLIVFSKVKALKEWIHYRSAYLDELLRLDGHDGLACSRCGAIEAMIRCTECHSLPVFCETCAVDVHTLNPLHRIEVSHPVLGPRSLLMNLQKWVDGYWSKSSLRALGMTVQLGHPAHDKCLNPTTSSLLILLHVNGFHVVNVQYCNCKYSPLDSLKRCQLFRAGWYPATHERPESAFTLAMLDSFHEMTLQGKISAHDYYQSLVNISDNAGLDQIPVRSTFLYTELI